MKTALDPRGVYRVVFPDDTEPRARLCVAPRVERGQLTYFDSLRDRALDGRFVSDARAQSDAVVFELRDGARLFLEPMTLPRWREIAALVDGRPEFASDAELRAFYLELAGVRGAAERRR